MTAHGPSGSAATLAARARRLGEQASAMWQGVASGAEPRAPQTQHQTPAQTPPLTPRGLMRSLSRRTRARALDRLRNLACFAAQDYLALHPDVDAAGFDAVVHALFVGSQEGRTLFRPERLARALGATGAALPGPLPHPAIEPHGPPVGVFVSSHGNVFMQDIARDIAQMLGESGVLVTLRDETAPGARLPPVKLIVAPHEFFRLGRGPDWVQDELLGSAIMVNTEQLQTPWFAAALPFLLASAGVVDFCARQTRLFAQAGVPAFQLTPVPGTEPGRVLQSAQRHKLFHSLPEAAAGASNPATPFANRPLDLAFFGTETPHREAWLARNAAFLSDLDSFIYFRRNTGGPIRSDSNDGSLSALASHVCGHSKIMLNLHRDDFGYFEWHRIVRLGMASGAVVISEPCPPHPEFQPGVHFLEAHARQIPDLAEWLLTTPDGQARAAQVQAAAAQALAVLPGGAALALFLHEYAAAG